jgi:hypothetical protein
MLQVIDAHRQVRSIGVNLAPEARRARRSKASLEPRMMRGFGIPCQIGKLREAPFANAREEIARTAL